MHSTRTIRVSKFVCKSCQAASIGGQRRQASIPSSSPEIYDVVTVGGGPVGLALLAALKSSPKTKHLRTALVETQDLDRQSRWSLSAGQYSNRASSLTPYSVEFLEQIGAWSHVEHGRTKPYNEMQVWDASNDATIKFDWKAEAQRYNAPPPVVATMTENANLTRGILKRIEDLKAKDCLLMNTKVSSIEMGQDQPEGVDLSNWPLVSLDSSATSSSTSAISARLLVGADGFNSPVRAFAGINSYGWDYDRHGVVATLKVVNPEVLEESGAVVAFQRFIPQLGGPIAILPLPDEYASLVWSTTPRNAAFLKSLEPASFVAMVNAALSLSQTDLQYMLSLDDKAAKKLVAEYQWRASQSTARNQRHPVPQVIDVQDRSIASFPLRFRQATSLTGPRIALIGDAAHTIHPLAGQGLNLGLADARSLAETIGYSVEHGMDLGDSLALQRFSSDRFGKGLLMGGGVDALNWMYQFGAGEGISGNLVSNARGLGMKFFGSSLAEQTGLKGAIMRVAGGS